MAPSSQVGYLRNPLADVGCLLGYPSIQSIRDPSLGHGKLDIQWSISVAAFCKARCRFSPGGFILGLWRAGLPTAKGLQGPPAVGRGCACWPATRPLSPYPNQNPLPMFRRPQRTAGIGPIAVELCCLFDLISRAPLRFVFDKSAPRNISSFANSSNTLKRGICFCWITAFTTTPLSTKSSSGTPISSFPLRRLTVPKLSNPRPRDYLCQITDSTAKTTLTVRVVFVYRNGFRRRRLVTSLFDPFLFPVSELANLYHLRWDIETFYRDFKHTLKATSWHCKSPTSFHQELLVHMIALCLIRMAMLEASSLVNVPSLNLAFLVSSLKPACF